MHNPPDMSGQGFEAPAQECGFPTACKAYRRSSTWNPRSGSAAPASAQAGAAPPQEPVRSKQNGKARASLPPLQPLSVARRSLEEWPRVASDDVGDTAWAMPSTPGHRKAKVAPPIKLDLGSVRRTMLEPSEMELKREKFAFFDKECSRVCNSHIYLGSNAVARNKETLKANGITHVLNCVGFVCPEYFKKDFIYKTLWLEDSPGEDITSLLYDVFDYFQEVQDQQGRVFVHCCQGVSRSTSLVIAYLMWRDRLSFEEAFQDVKASRGVTNPNMGFACQLLQCQKRVNAAPMSPNSVLRMYRLAPHSPYDPLHLVPKAVIEPGAAALDSRGAFVIHVPFAIFVWIGCNCDPKISQAAKVAAGQVVRYERAQVPVHIIEEGLESSEFWDALTKYGNETDSMVDTGMPEMKEKGNGSLVQVEKIRELGVGNRLVPEYSADFELFQRAKQGGVVPPVPSTGLDLSADPTRIPAREDGWSLLRQRFISGELFPSKSLESAENLETSIPSPNASMDSSSIFSTFSRMSSLSSTSGYTGCDSPFPSPCSNLSISSPNTPISGTPHQSPEPGFLSCCVTPDGLTFSSTGNAQRSFPCDKQIPLMLASNRPAILQTRQKGTHASIPVQMPGSDSNSPPAFPDPSSGDPISTQCDTVVNESLDHTMVEADCDEEPSGFEFSSSTNPLTDVLELGHPVLYAWPRFKRIVMFDVGNLDSKSVLLLIAPQPTVSHPRFVVYIWVGKECDQQVENDNEHWQLVAQEYLQQLKCEEKLPIKVAKQGHEPTEFWEKFKW